MLSHHDGQELDRITARLAGSGALALLLVEAEPLERIERRYGGEAYHRCMEALKALVDELAQEAAPGEEILVTQERSRGGIAAFFFCSRSDHEFYGTRLPELTGRMSHELVSRGRRAVYPYLRDPLELAVGSSVVLYNPTVKSEWQIRQALEDARRDAHVENGLRARENQRELLRVVLAGQISVRYEAIVDLNSADILGYEALSRGPEGSDLSNPRDLFRRAENAGLLFELDCLCRKVALENSHRLPRQRALFLNCLPTAIGDPNLRADGLRKLLENFELQPSQLVLEISESESIENFAVFREVAASCRELGIRIAVDDAGTGYTSLEAIMEISPDFIKTDMSLVRGIDQDAARQQVLRAMHAVAEGMGATVIAEGVETEGELRVLRDLGVRYGQGFYFGAPVRAEPV